MLLTEDTRQVFNVEEIHAGTVVYAKKTGWDEGITGIALDASAHRLRIVYLPKIQNVANQIFIPASEVAQGLWELRYSSDGLETVRSYPEEGNDGT